MKRSPGNRYGTNVGLFALLLVVLAAPTISGQQPASTAASVVPTLVNLSGVLTDVNGKPLTGAVGVTFSLYKDEQGGAPLWMETQNVHPDKLGHYSVMLGSASSQGLPADLFASGEARWLGVQAQDQAEQARVMLLSVPYALKAGDAETLGGKPASAFLEGSGNNSGLSSAISGTGKPNYMALWKTSNSLTSSSLFQSPEGNLGIGTTKPAAPLDVAGRADIRNTLTLFPQGSPPTLTISGTAFRIGGTGLVSFVNGQTFPGTGTITGVSTASGSGLTGGGNSGNLSLSLLNTCSSGQVLQWSGSAWACSSAGSGTITGVTAGTDLTGGGSSGNVTLNVDTTKVPQLAGGNSFTGNQLVTGNLSATGVVTGSSYQIGSNLFAFGSYANSNAFLGFAGNTTMTGTSNTASGLAALFSNTTGYNNTATGWDALAHNTTGHGNTATGVEALDTNTGHLNTATGWDALEFNTTAIQNTATGSFALQFNSTGSYNTATGSSALPSNTTGMFETADGMASGVTKDSSSMTGSNNTFLGSFAAVRTGTLTNASAIGALAEVDASNAMVLGSINGVNGATSNTNVGIGTTTPASALDVHGTGNFTGLVTFAANQSFPNTISGVTTASGSGLTGGGNSGKLNLSLLNTCANGQVLAWNGSAWACTNLTGGGTVTSVGSGPGLTGGPITSSGTLAIDPTVVPQLNVANTFTGNQTVNGNLSATGLVTGSGYQIGSNLFGWGSYTNSNAFVGFAGNPNLTTGRANTGVGVGALAAVTDGGNNTATGYQALLSNTDGSDNTATGLNALSLNTTGSANTATGTSALTNNTVGGFNTATGASALANNTTGGSNTATGVGALQNNAKGSSNTADGLNALGTSIGNNNTALGDAAGASNTTGSQNTFVGYSADAGGGTFTNATAIGANAIVTESNALVLGGTGANAVSVGIGTPTPAYTLDVQGTGNFTGVVNFSSKQIFPNTIAGVTTASGSGLTGGGNSGTLNLSLVNTCASGQVLSWNGSAWACSSAGTGTITGVTAGTDLTGGGTSGNVTLNLDTSKVTLLAANNAFTGNNTFTGNQTVSGNLSATGVVSANSYQIGSNLFAWGGYAKQNAFLGFAGNPTTMGSGNTAAGYGADASATGDIGSTAIGYDALYSNTEGNSNTASGISALYANTTGGANVASGSIALYSNTTGSFNTGIGAAAGLVYDNSFMTGSNNTFMWYNTEPSTGTLSNATAVGANAEVSESNAMVLGSINGVNTATANTLVGIGTTAPQYLLHIGNQGGSTYNNFLRIDGPASGTGNAISIGGHGDFAIDAVNNAAGRFVVKDTTGFVGIGVPNPLGNPFQIAQGMGSAIADGWATYSSRRWKTNIHPLTDALAKVEQLRGVSYDLKTSGKHEIGVIAEEVGEVVPEVVTYEENGKDARAVDYSRLTALLIEAVKQQQKQIAVQQAQINGQRQLLGAQQLQINKQQHLMAVQKQELARLNLKVGVLEASLGKGSEQSVALASETKSSSAGLP